MRPIPRQMLTRGFGLTVALGAVCSAAALIAGWVPIPGAVFTSPTLSTSADVAGLSSFSDGAQTSVTNATLPVSHEAEAAESQGAPLANQPDKASGLLARMNAARAKEGTHDLMRAAGLDAIALQRAQDLLRLDYFEHYGPEGESAFSELRARGIKYRIAGENLARNNASDARTVASAFEALMASPGHRENIVEPRFTSVGIAAVQSGDLWLYVTVFTN